MATVTGTFGEEKIFLDNAATEETLKQLVTAIGILAAKSGKDIKTQKQLESELKKFHKALSAGEKAIKKTTKAEEDAAKAKKKSTQQAEEEDKARKKATNQVVAGKAAIEGLTKAAESTIVKMTGMISQISSMGSSFTAAAGVFNNIPLIGGILGPVFSAIGGAAESLTGTFRTSSSVGANFNGSIRKMALTASGAGLTIEQFTGLIAKNGENLMFLGGTTQQGAELLGKLGKQIRGSRLQADLARLGYSAEDITTGMAKFGGMMARSGKQMDQKALIKSTGEYLKNLDAVSRLTGKTKESLQAEADARMADSQYRMMLAKLDPGGAANLEKMMNAIPKQHQAGLKEILATGTAVSDEAQAAMYYLNKTGQNAMVLGQQMRATGTLTEEQANQFDAARQSEMKQMAEDAKNGKGVIGTLGLFGDALQQQFTVGILDAAARTKTLAEVTAEQTSQLDKQNKMKKDDLDPAALLKFEQALAETSNQLKLTLGENIGKLMDAFNKLKDVLFKYVIPAFNWFMDNFETVIQVILGFKLALGAVNLALKAIEGYKAIFGPGSSPLRPMFVKEVGGLDLKKVAKTGATGAAGFIAANVAVGAVGATLATGESVKATEAAKQGDAVKATEANRRSAQYFQGAMSEFADPMIEAENAKAQTIIDLTEFAKQGNKEAIDRLAKMGVDWKKDVVKAELAAKKSEYMKTQGLAWDPVRHAYTKPGSGFMGIGKTHATPAQIKAADEYAAGKTKLPTVKTTATPSSPIPTSAAKPDAVKKTIEEDAKKKEDAIKAEADANKKVKDLEAKSAKPLTGQETPEQLLASLNNKLDMLLTHSRSAIDIASRQLTVQQGLSGNLHLA